MQNIEGKFLVGSVYVVGYGVVFAGVEYVGIVHNDINMLTRWSSIKVTIVVGSVYWSLWMVFR